MPPLAPTENQLNPNANERSPYLTASKWVHEETSEYYEDEGRKRRDRTARLQPRCATAGGSRGAVPPPKSPNKQSPGIQSAERKHGGDAATSAHDHSVMVVAQEPAGPSGDRAAGNEIVCGPLLNYRRMERNKWIGSVLCVCDGGGKHIVDYQAGVVLKVRRIPLHGHGGPETNGATMEGFDQPVETCAEILYSDPRNTFWQFDVEVEMDQELESRWEYAIEGLWFPPAATKPQRNSFFVPAVNESMRILFFSCNGFSVGTDEDAWSGPALWHDVMRQQNSEAPFHVM